MASTSKFLLEYEAVAFLNAVRELIQQRSVM